jgi:hypothetical protein
MANRFWVGGTATWDGTTTANWSTTSGGGSGASVPGTADVAVFDGGSGAAVVTVAASIGGTNTLSGITLTGTGGFAGTLDFSVNNPSLTMASFSVTGTAARTVNLGTGTFTLTGINGNIWDATVVTGPLTLSAGSATLVASNTTPNAPRTFVLGGQIYGTISVGAVTNSETIVFTTGTVGTLNITAPQNLNVTGGNTLTVTNPFNWVGTSGSQIGVMSNAVNVLAAISVASGAPTIAWAAVRALTFTGGATFTASNSFDLKSNSGISITPPSGGAGGGVFGS